MSIRILYRDSWLCICEKPVGVLSENEGMPELLKSQLSIKEIYPVHRLDQGVGGIMVFALQKQTATDLVAMFANGAVTKEYLAVVSNPPDSAEGTCFDYLYHDKKHNKTYPVNGMRKGVKLAQLAWIMLETVPKVQSSLALLRIALHTGRSHQIRVQFATRHMPLIGDGKYGSRFKSPSIGLWAYSLSFRHPSTGEMLNYSLLPPPLSPWNDFNFCNK